MKIMYVNTLGVWGGVATYLKPLIYDQLKRGNHVSLVVGNEGELTDYVKVRFPEVKLIILSSMKRDVDIKGIFKSIFKFRRIVKTEKPDVIHLNCIMAGIIGRLGSIFTGTKIVYNAHGWAFGPRISKKYKWPAIIIEKSLAFITNKIICVSEYEKKAAKKYHIFKNKKQSIVIKNACEDLGFFGISKRDSKSFTITMAARFLEPKNQKLLLKSIKKINDNYSLDVNLKVNLLGDGPLLEDCKTYVQKNSLKEIVTFTGKVNNVQDYYKISDVVMLITNYDAIAISLIEALSLGKPIIASNVAGVPETFSDHINGFCVQNNVDEISNAILKMIKNPNLTLSMSKNSRKLYEEDFNIQKNLDMHNSLYDNLIKN